MGKLFKAILGFAIALTLLHGKDVWTGLDSKPLRDIRDGIARERPEAQLDALLGQGMAALGGLEAPQNGTDHARERAHRLHS